jgi:hypothetical protein
MKWKYYIPAEWNPNDRHTWEDVWLLPHDENYHGESVWLTVDSLTSAAEYLPEQTTQVEAGSFRIDGEDMVVGINDFSKDELLHWVEVWLSESGFSAPELLEASFEDFRNTNDDSRALSQAMAEMKEEDA